MMPEMVRATFFRLKASWLKVLAVHLCYTGLGVILFAPLLGVLGQVLLKFSGKPALADMDLLYFAMSPAGAAAFILFIAITIVISAFELASLMVIGLADASGKRADVLTSLLFSLRRVLPIFNFAGRLVVKLLVTVAPFLAAAAGAAYFLISDHDVNYYLAVQPAEFWVAAVAIGFIALLMAALVIYRLVSWSLALPLVLFAGTAPAHSFAASEKLTHFNRRMILSVLLAWLISAILLGALVTGCVQLLAHWLVPLFLNSVPLLAALFGLLTAFWTIANVIVTALIAGGLALLLAALVYRLSPDCRVFTLPPGKQPGAAFAQKIRYRFVIGLVAAVGSAAFIGYGLLQEIQIDDDVQIIAHRGAASVAPENTMAAVRRAMVDGADWIEIDVQETADGEVVVIHDSDFMKLANKDLRVWDARMEQLAEIDVGGWFSPDFSGERVPRLAEVLAHVKGRSRLIIELKYYGHDQQLEQRVIDLVEAAGMQNDTMIMSLEFAGIQKVRELRPDWRIGLLAAQAIGDLTRLDADFLAVNMALARPERIRTAHAAEKELFVWTVNDALSMSQLMSLGVDGIITDDPRLGREVLAARAELSTAERLLLHMAPWLGIEAPALRSETNDAEIDDTNNNLELTLHQRLQDRIGLVDSELSAFTTDGCSGGLSVGWDYFSKQAGFFKERHGTRPPWENCCVEHDRAYHAGGGAGLTPAEGFAAREQADEELRACVMSTVTGRREVLRSDYHFSDEEIDMLYATISESMFQAVRLGGMPCTGLSWRWGYGWPDCK